MDHKLDITGEICPMTMVRTRLLIDKMKKGETAELMLKGSESLKNIHLAIRELGDKVISVESIGNVGAQDIFKLVLQRQRT